MRFCDVCHMSSSTNAALLGLQRNRIITVQGTSERRLSQHSIVIFGMLSAAWFPSTLVPNKSPFVPVSLDDISSVANTGQIAVMLPQSSSTFPLYLFFPFIDGTKQDTLHLILYCMSTGQAKPWWNSPKFVSLSFPIAGLDHDQGQPTRWHH